MKHISLVTSLFLCFSMFAVNAFAQDTTTTFVPVQVESTETSTNSTETQTVTPTQEDSTQATQATTFAFVPVQIESTESATNSSETQNVATTPENSIQPVQDVYAQQNTYDSSQQTNVQPEYVENATDYNEHNSYWKQGFSLSAKIGAEVMAAGILNLWAGYGGVSGGIEFGYHWEIFGIYVAQQFANAWQFDNSLKKFDSEEDQDSYNKKNKAYSSAMSMTSLDVRWFLPSQNDRLRFSLGCGLGLNYNIKKEEDADRSIIFLLRLHFGVNYLMTQNLSLGFRLDYSMFSFILVNYHQIEPAFTVSYTF